MRIISKRALIECWERHADAKQPLEAWYKSVVEQSWTTPTSVLALWPRASVVGDDRLVFRIKGNHYRLVVRVNYQAGIVYIRFVDTHAEYNRVNAGEV